ncbi:MAG: biosynthetic peptidoglycan transglycosylase [bacterium]
MTAFLKRHKIVGATILLVVLLVLYFSFVAIKAYFDIHRIIAEIESSGRIVLKLEEIPADYVISLLAVEDPNFYTHSGIDITTPGAGWTTITQGIVKIYFFDGFSPGFLRYKKMNQSLIAWILNQRVDKNTQLQIFINSVFLGNHNSTEVIGFQEGSKVYFNKEFSQLNGDEFLSLVAMIIAPNQFNVVTQTSKNRERVNRIKRLLNGECKPVELNDVYYKNCK